jgi:hypothetical protein
MLKPKAERDLLIIKKSGNKAAINKIQQIFKELSNTPYDMNFQVIGVEGLTKKIV